MHFKLNYILVVLLLLVCFSGGAFATDIMPLTEVRPGMEGIGKTVFSGYAIESFPVKIIDVLEGQGLDDDLILIRAAGEEIDRIGGIAAGMSGSPVYIMDRLVGAVSYGWAFSDQHYALVTPIERMLELLAETDREGLPVKDEGALIKVKERKGLLQRGERIALKTPLYVSGLKGRALDRLEEGLSRYNFKVLPGTIPLESREDEAAIRPGSAVAVQLVRGDVNIASIGTVTYRDGNDLLAFGHPFLNRGGVEYLMSSAYISSVIPSIEQPFKLGAPTDKLLGSIRVDRAAGIAGKLEVYPRIIPLRIKVTDRDLGLEKQIAVQLVRDENLLTPLAVNVALQSLDSTLDRIGPGTARVFYKLTGSGLPDLGVERSDIYYSRNDIAAMALGDFYRLLNMITTNPFKQVNLIDLKLEVEVEDRDQVALVQKAKVLNKEIRPGETLRIEVTLHPYRQEVFTKEVSLKLPEDIQPGMSTVLIDGGFTGQSYQLPVEEDLDFTQETNQAVIEGYRGFQEILDEFLKQPRNNELIIQVLPAYPIAVEGDNVQAETADSSAKGKEKSPEKPQDEQVKQEEANPGIKAIDDIEEDDDDKAEIKEIVETDFVLEGNLTLEINIEDPEGSTAGDGEVESGAAVGENRNRV